MNDRENYLRNARMQGPSWIPSLVVISGASWQEHGSAMQEVLLRHPRIFPGFRPGSIDFEHLSFDPIYRAGGVFTDAWDCEWHFGIGGLEGVVMRHPLADWRSLESFRAPDPLAQWDREPANWAAVEAESAARRARGELVSGSVPHGFLFDRLTYLRGFENLMLDMAEGAPELPRLIEILYRHNRALVDKWLTYRPDVIELADDLGAQTSSMIGPRMLRRWLSPAYQKLIEPCRAAGSLVAFHSDGYILNLIDDLLATGVDIINPQDLVNGIDNLAREVKGRACIRLDIDRQSILPFGSRAQVRELIEAEVRLLGDPRGGLEFICGIYPPTPPAQVDALACALEEFRDFWWR